MGIFDSILGGFGKVLSNPTVQSGIGAGLDWYMNKRAGDKTQATINQMGRYDPRNVYTGFGNFIQNPDGSMSFGGGMSDQLLGMGADTLGHYQADPQAAAQQRYQLLTDMALPQENRMFNRLKDNLFASGRSGTTGGLVTGDNSLRAFQESSNMADLQRQMAGQDFARQQNADIYSQGMGFMNGAFAPFGALAQAGIQAGSPNAAAGAAGTYGDIAKQLGSQTGNFGSILQGGLEKIFGPADPGIAIPHPIDARNPPVYNPGNQPRPL